MNSISIPKGWKIEKLERVCKSIRSGGTPPRENAEYFGGNIPWVKMTDLKTDYIFDTEEKLTAEGVKRSSAKIFPKDTVLIAMYTHDMGKTAILSVDAATNQAICGLECNENLIPRFLYYFLKKQQDEIRKLASGGAQPNINQGKVKNLEIPIPPIETQEKIVQKLDYILDQIEEKKKEILELQKKQLLTRLTEAMKYSVLKAATDGRFSNNKWHSYRRSKIGSIATVTSGGTPDRQNSSYWGGNIPWVKSGELLDGDIYETEECITKEGLKNSSAKLFPVETVLVALYGQGLTRGRTGRLMREASTNQACCAILPTASLDSRYLQLWLRSIYREMRRQTRTGPQPNWNASMIKNIEIVIPPLGEQRNIVNEVSNKISRIELIQSTLSSLKKSQEQIETYLESVRAEILNVAFSGKLVD